MLTKEEQLEKCRFLQLFRRSIKKLQWERDKLNEKSLTNIIFVSNNKNFTVIFEVEDGVYTLNIIMFDGEDLLYFDDMPFLIGLFGEVWNTFTEQHSSQRIEDFVDCDIENGNETIFSKATKLLKQTIETS